MDEETMEIFRKNFEKQYGKVDMEVSKKKAEKKSVRKKVLSKKSKKLETQIDEHDEKPLIVKHKESSKESISMIEKNQRKLFMGPSAPQQEKKVDSISETPQDKEDIKNDLALQRLIEESHILAEASKRGHYTGADISSSTEFNFTPTGKYRLKALDARMNSLGVKKSSEKMSMHVRKGMIAKNIQRKSKMEKEAKEAGIVLARSTSKSSSSSSSSSKRRDFGLKIASVGKNTRHGLTISQKEIAKYTSKRRKK